MSTSDGLPTGSETRTEYLARKMGELAKAVRKSADLLPAVPISGEVAAAAGIYATANLLDEVRAALAGEREPSYCGLAFGFGGGLGDPVYICDRPRGHAGRHFGHPVESGEVLVSLAASPRKPARRRRTDRSHGRRGKRLACVRTAAFLIATGSIRGGGTSTEIPATCLPWSPA